MYNWSLIDNKLPFNLYNIKLNYSLFGTKDEAWFSIVTIAIEQNSAEIIKYIKKIYNNLEIDNLENIKKYLYHLNTSLYKNITIIKSLNINTCNPDYFFYIMRPVLEGFWDKNKFPNGLILEDIDHKFLAPKGGSAGQSILIQIIDIIYGIAFEEEQGEFVKEVRYYMPIKHRKFIEEFIKLPKLKDYIINKNNIELINLFNTGIYHIINYREYHLKLIYNYIVNFNDNSLGTGGTLPNFFLSKMINNTRKSLINIHSKL
jgi:indoleamine 2,3-dioxygenase